VTDREILEEIAIILRSYGQAQKEFLERVVCEHYRMQESILDRLFDRLEHLLSRPRGPQPPAPPPARVN
jgi:hypothetical protein